ncbi:MAG TPA: hypothetical protein PLX16_05955 [Exilispira sp.]|nr:hypothetical protein [Exilispira sp.]
MARIKEILERIACSLEIIANNLSPDNLKDENVKYCQQSEFS